MLFWGETALAIAIIGLSARAALLIIAPLPIPPAPGLPAEVAPDSVYASASLSGGHPFAGRTGTPAPQAATPLEESALGIVLYGTWRGGGGLAAILATDGAPQKKVMAGEEIVAGVRLEDVQDEYVVINNQGTLEAVPIFNRKVEIAPNENPLEALAAAPEAPSVALASTLSSARTSSAPVPGLRDATGEHLAALAPYTGDGAGDNRLSEAADAAMPNATE
ncbi:MAG: type II secretion system protein N [Parvularculaceae bacterium]